MRDAQGAVFWPGSRPEKINIDIRAEAEKREIEWRFSPPSAPHFEGVWERLVKCCKSSLTHVLKEWTVSDEVHGFRRDRVTDGRTATYTYQRGSQGPVPAYSESLPARRAASQPTGRHHQPHGETVKQKLEKGPTNHRWLLETMVDRIRPKPNGEDQVDEKRESPASWRLCIGCRQDEWEGNLAGWKSD